jgi:tetrapyrrole methylase family protein / MazG family protein
VITVVGLGPAGADHLLPAARRALDAADVRFARTARHPAVADLAAEGLVFTSFDDVYDAAPDLESAYRTMVERVVAAAAGVDRVVFAVPGNPGVAERTVELLRAADVDVVAGLSFADLAWSRVGVDAMATGARIVDARAIDDVDFVGPMLIAQCDQLLLLSDVKLALLEHLDPAAPVTVLQRLGLPDEHVEVRPLVELDRGLQPDHLTSLYVDAGNEDTRIAAIEVARLVQLTRRLRAPGGCPWDAEQTHRSLTRYVVEEAYEAVEVIEQLPDPAAYRALADELGDVLYQVAFHAVIAEETDEFTMADVARGIHDKLVRRHPHVFGDVVADEPADVVRNWEQIKKDEKGHDSLMEGITESLPSLLYTSKLFRKAASVGLPPGTRDEALDRIAVAAGDLRTADTSPDVDVAFAQLLAAAVVLARATGVDAESALRGWAARYRARFEAMEQLASERGLELSSLDPPAVAALWLEAGSR